MVGNRQSQHVHTFKRKARAEQNMVQAALRPPAGEGRLDLRRQQAEIAQRRVLQQVVGVGVHVAHQYLMPIVADQVANVGQLPGPGAAAECQVHHHHHQRVRALAKTQQDRAASRRPR